MTIKHRYIHKFKDTAKLIYFDTGNQVTQAYYDYYCLAYSDEIFMSQKFSTFSKIITNIYIFIHNWFHIMFTKFTVGITF